MSVGKRIDDFMVYNPEWGAVALIGVFLVAVPFIVLLVAFVVSS